MSDDGSFQVRVSNDTANMIRASVQSRSSNNNKHDVWIQGSRTNISGCYCTYKGGGRGLGCCSHIASIIWFWGYARYHREVLNQRSDSFHDFVTNAVDNSSDISSDDGNDDSNTEDDNNDNESYIIIH